MKCPSVGARNAANVEPGICSGRHTREPVSALEGTALDSSVEVCQIFVNA